MLTERQLKALDELRDHITALGILAYDPRGEFLVKECKRLLRTLAQPSMDYHTVVQVRGRQIHLMVENPWPGVAPRPLDIAVANCGNRDCGEGIAYDATPNTPSGEPRANTRQCHNPKCTQAKYEYEEKLRDAGILRQS